MLSSTWAFVSLPPFLSDTTPAAMQLPEGLYDALVTQSLAQALQHLDVKLATALERLSVGEAGERLSEAFARQLASLLDALRAENPGAAEQELRLVNDLLLRLREQQRAATDALDPFVSPPQVLRAIHHPGSSPEMPETGLAIPWLFTAGKGSPSLLNELRREMANCDQADLLVSFITVAGVRKILDIFQNATAVNAVGRRRITIRVLTTTYTGATEQEALDLLAKLPGCQVNVSLDGRRSRLHAKAWIFHRKTGFGSAYAGSANCQAPLFWADWSGRSSSPSEDRVRSLPGLKLTSKLSGTTASSSGRSRRCGPPGPTCPSAQARRRRANSGSHNLL